VPGFVREADTGERERGREGRRESERAVVMASCVLYTLVPTCSTEQSVHHNIDNNEENSLYGELLDL